MKKNYKVLARKWRPKKYKEIIGQEHVIEIIKNSILLNRIHHAWIFSGDRGVGKTSIARLFAKSLSCKKKINFIHCNNCNNCKQINNKTFMDLIEIDAASKTKIEDVRNLLNNMQYLPINGRFKIYLIDEIHMLSKKGFNTLLKILEEPPNYIKFLFATTNIKRIPNTIISRCLVLNFKNIEEKKIYKKLKYILLKENINFKKKSIRLISNIANGSMRDALNLTEQSINLGNGNIFYKKIINILGISKNKYSISLIEYLFFKKSKKIIKILNKLHKYNINWNYLLDDILFILHHILILKIFPKHKLLKYNKQQNKKLFELSKIIKNDIIKYFYKKFLIGKKNLKFSPNYYIGVEIIFLNILNKNF